MEGLEIQTAEAEEDRSASEAIDHSDILAYLNGGGSSSRRRQWTPDRSVILKSSWPYKRADCDSVGSLLWFLHTVLLLNNVSLTQVIHHVILSQCK